MTYLTEAEIEAIQHLDRAAPYCIGHVSQGQFSVARHYGTCRFNGHLYTYFPPTDELIRNDVLKFVAKLRKPKREKRESGQLDLGGLFS